MGGARREEARREARGARGAPREARVHGNMWQGAAEGDENDSGPVLELINLTLRACRGFSATARRKEFLRDA